MTKTQEDSEAVVVTNHLNAREQIAYDMHMKKLEPPLAPALCAELFELYLNGLSLADIVKANKGLKMGAVVRASLEGDWYDKRLAYQENLLQSVVPRVQQVQAEAILFTSSLMAVAHKLHGAKINRFLQTGDETELGDFAPRTFEAYRKAAELALKLTGQDGKGGKQENNTSFTKVVIGQVPQATVPSVNTITIPNKAILPEEAQKLLAAFEDVDDEGSE